MLCEICNDKKAFDGFLCEDCFKSMCDDLEQSESIEWYEDSGYGPLEVLRSNAGWYIGRKCYDLEGYEQPTGTRESHYFSSTEEAEIAFLTNKWQVRNCVENNHMYNNGFPRPIAHL